SLENLAFLAAHLTLALVDDVLGRFGDHAPLVVEPFPAGPSGDLLEVADRENGRFLAVEFGEAGEENGADGDVDADAQRIGAADDPEQALLRELLHEQAVFGEQTRVVDADAEGEEAAELLAVRRVEAEAGDRVADLVALLAGGDLHAGERLRELGTLALREVDDVDRCLARL